MLFANSVRRTGNWLLLMGWKSRALRGVRGSSLQPPEGGNQGSPLGLYWHGQAWGYSFLSSVRLGWIGIVWMFLSYKVPPHCPFGQTEQAFRWSFFSPCTHWCFWLAGFFSSKYGIYETENPGNSALCYSVIPGSRAVLPSFLLFSVSSDVYFIYKVQDLEQPLWGGIGKKHLSHIPRSKALPK